MQRTGALLKQGREQKGLSLNEVSIATKINAKILAAIEEADMDNLPSRTFLRGFIQSYATYLKLDVNTILESFSEEFDTNKDTESTATPTTPPRKLSKKVQKVNSDFLNSKIIFSAIGIVALIGLIIGVKNVVEKYEQESQATVIPSTITKLEPDKKPIDNDPSNVLAEIDEDILAIAEEQKNKQEKASQKATEEEAKRIAIETAAKKKAEEEAKRVAAEEEAKRIAAEAAAKKKAEEEAKRIAAEAAAKKKAEEEAKRIAAEAAAKKKAETQKQAAADSTTSKKPELKIRPQEIIIEALDEVKIDFRIDNGELVTIQLEPEQLHTIKARSQAAIDISDGGVVNIIHNGKDRGVPGELGKPVKVRFP